MRNAMRMLVRTNLMMPRETVDRVDRIAGPRGRSRFVTEAVEERLRREERMASLREAAGAWRDHPLFPTDESVVEWVRAGRAERTTGDEADL